VATYDPRTALAVVDLQNDFADPAGSLYVLDGQNVVPFANRQIDAALDAGAAVIYTQDWHPPDTPHFEKDGGVWPVHCVRETWGADFHPDLYVDEDAPIVRKGVGGEDGYSAFTVADPSTGERSATELESLLRETGAERLVIVGLATDYCVKATALDGMEKGYATVVMREGIRAVELDPGDGAAAVQAMIAAGVTVA
jgi:nicotinamidase/pyrazinamidase